MDAKKPNEERGLVIISIIALLIVSGLWYFSYMKLKDLPETDRGTFGDMFGAINALFSGLAFAGIIITILLQRKELSLQRLELEETRRELKRTADAQVSQNQYLLNQQYQSTYFSLLSGHSELIESLIIWEKRGFEGLATFYETIFSDVEVYSSCIEHGNFPNHDATSRNPAFTLQFNSRFLHAIFEDLITLIKFIDDKLTQEDKLNDPLYYEILYNRLTVYEKYLIGLYCDCFNDEYSQFFKRHKYNFKRFYDIQDARYPLSPNFYFPELEISRENVTNVFRSNINHDCELYLFYISTERDLGNQPLYLDKIVVHGSRFINGRREVSFSEIVNVNSLIVNNEQNHNLVEVNLMKDIYKQILTFTNEGNYNINFEFIFRYQNRSFLVRYATSLFYGNFQINPEAKVQEYMLTLIEEN